MSLRVKELKKTDISYEDHLVRVLNRNGFTAYKLIGALPQLPDVLAGDGESIMMFQIETSKDSQIHIGKRKIWILKKIAKDFKAEPWLAFKFTDQHVGWLFCNLSALEMEKETFSINYETARVKGFDIRKLISNELQQRLL